MLLRNWIYNTNVITIFAGTASSEPYICYYCQSAAAHIRSTLDHTICYHPNEKFTYRYLLLDETDGIMKYRSRHLISRAPTSYHGLLSVRYVALYDRIETQWHVFVKKCKRFIGENINKHFPWKMPGRCPSTSFFQKQCTMCDWG